MVPVRRRRPAAKQSDQAKPISLFYSYSHKDEDLRRKLETHLSALRRGGLIAEWHDRKLEPGDAWKDQIDRHLTSADIVLLLVSSDFIASDYCWGEEMTKALARHARGEARVIPVILRHCRWRSTPLANLQAVPKEARPIKSWPDEDEAFDDVVAAIERSVQIARQMVATEQPSAPSHKRSPLEWEPGRVFRDSDAPWCPELVVIPGGMFAMGSPEEEKGRDPNEGPQHEVRFAQPFALGRYPVTFEEYDHFCAGAEREKPDDRGWGRGRRPAMNVSWKDAQAYCAWLSEQTGQGYRLPSEAEWEYACRAGTTTRCWWGNDIKPANANFWESVGKTTEMGSYPANPWGLHDMNGNVWEWCEDCWNDSYEGAPEAGSSWMQGNCSRRVVRGGSWATRELKFRRSASRFKYTPGVRYSWLGFRVARELTAQPTTVAAKETHWSNLMYHDPAMAGRVTFDYSNNNGRYSIGRDEFFFETMWSKASDRAIHLYADPDSISGIAEAPGLQSYRDVGDPASYDMSSRVRTIPEGEHTILRNRHNNYAVLRILDVKDRSLSDSIDELTFEFWIRTNAT